MLKVFIFLLLFTNFKANAFFGINEAAYKVYQNFFHISKNMRKKTTSIQLNNTLCENFGGVVKSNTTSLRSGKTLYISRCTCKINNMPIITQKDGDDCLKSSVKKLTLAFKNLNSDPLQKCGVQENLMRLTSSFKCPVHLIRRLEYARRTSFAGLIIDKSNQICNVTEGKDKRNSYTLAPVDFEDRLKQLYNVNTPDQFINKCLNQFKGRYSDDEKNNFIGNYYITQEKIKNKMKSLLQKIAENNYLTGFNINTQAWHKRECHDLRLESLNQTCKQMRQCLFANNEKILSNTKNSLLRIYPKYQKLLKEIKKTKMEISSIQLWSKSVQRLKKNKNKMNFLTKKLEHKRRQKGQLEMFYPWFRGSKFNDIIDHKNFSKLSEKKKDSKMNLALIKQAESNQELLRERFNEYKKALSCLNSGSEINDCNSFEELVNDLDLDEKNHSFKGYEQSKMSLAMSKSECVNNAYSLQKGSTKLAYGTMVDISIVAGGSLFSFAKAVSLNNGSMKKVLKDLYLYRFSPPTQEIATDAIGLVTILSRIEYGVKGTNTIKTGVQEINTFMDSYHRCSKKVSQFKNLENDKIKNICTSKSFSNLNIKLNNTKECIVNGVLHLSEGAVKSSNALIDIIGTAKDL